MKGADYAFDPQQFLNAELHTAHNELDLLDIPRSVDGQLLTISQRCSRVVKAYLHETSTLRLRLIDHGTKK